MITDENHLQFDRKKFFNFWKWFTVLKTINRFLDLNFSFLHIRLWESAATEHWSLLVARIYCRRSLNFGIQLSESDNQDSGLFCRNLVICAGIQWRPATFIIFWRIEFHLNWSESGHLCRIPTIFAEIWLT